MSAVYSTPRPNECATPRACAFSQHKAKKEQCRSYEAFTPMHQLPPKGSVLYTQLNTPFCSVGSCWFAPKQLSRGYHTPIPYLSLGRCILPVQYKTFFIMMMSDPRHQTKGIMIQGAAIRAGLAASVLGLLQLSVQCSAFVTLPQSETINSVVEDF